jgi:hypothetical protein
VQIKPVPPWNHAKGHFEIIAKFDGGPGLPGVIAGGLDTAPAQASLVFETGDVIALPAMEREGDLGEGFECLLGVNPGGGITILSETVGLFYFLSIHDGSPG